MLALAPLALVLVHAVATAAQADAPAPVGPDAVWSPPPSFLAAFHAACDGRPGAITGCFMAQMKKAGASPAALAFARRVDGQGYLREFLPAGRVSLAFAEFPFRANENQLCFLVNGSPALLDVDDLSRLDRREIRANPDYAVIERQYPKVEFFPGPRSGPRAPRAVELPSGYQGFLVSYSLRDACHACRVVGEVRLRFDFDASGQFRGATIRQIRRIRD